MWYYWRNRFAIALVVILSTGCRPSTSGPSSGEAEDRQSAVLARLDRIKTDLAILEQLKRLESTLSKLDASSASTQKLDRIESALGKLDASSASTQKLARMESTLTRLDALAASMSARPSAAPPRATGQTGQTTSPSVSPVPRASSVAGGAYEAGPVTNGGTISGTISFEGKPRPPKSFKVEKTPEVCGKEDRLLHEMTVNNGKLADAVVVIEGVTRGKPFSNHVILGPPPGSRTEEGESVTFPGTTIRPEKCIFGSFTGVVANGSVLSFDNKDPVKHSPHTYGVKGRVRKSLHNQDLEGNGKLELAINFKKKTDKVIKLECDQHPHMQNWFYRVENPYYGFSGADGTFKIDQVPPGTYNLIAWHPLLGEIEKEVTVAPNGATEVPFEFSSKRRKRRKRA